MWLFRLVHLYNTCVPYDVRDITEDAQHDVGCRNVAEIRACELVTCDADQASGLGFRLVATRRLLRRIGKSSADGSKSRTIVERALDRLRTAAQTTP